MAFDLSAYLERQRERVDRALERALPDTGEVSEELARAMGAAVLTGGKRVRPILCLAACRAAGGREARALPAAVALELIHAGSLVFDDMPFMDDARQRRGRPTLHLQFREGVALQAADALITRAFEVLAGAGWSDDAAVQASLRLADVVGSRGMSQGQLLDLQPPEGEGAGEELLRRIHDGKTGVLIQACLWMGALAAGAEPEVTDRLERYGDHLGLAFQIVDDILDAEQPAEVLGKDAGKDQAMGRATFCTVLGLEAARLRAEDETRAALGALRGMGRRAQPLRALARYVLERRS